MVKLRSVLKKCVLPAVLAAAGYAFLFLLFGEGKKFVNAGFFSAFLYAYLIRICDDILDYQKDEREQKNLFPRKILYCFCAADVAGLAVLAILSGKFLFFAAAAVIFLPFAVKGKYRDYIKPFFLPAVIICIVFSSLKADFWAWVVSFVAFIADWAVILLHKEK